MRSVLGLCLLIALCASANVAARGHHKSGQVIARPSQAVIPSYVTSGGVRIYRDDSVPGVCGPTTTTLLPTMIHPSLAAADLRPSISAGPLRVKMRRTQREQI